MEALHLLFLSIQPGCCIVTLIAVVIGVGALYLLLACALSSKISREEEEE